MTNNLAFKLLKKRLLNDCFLSDLKIGQSTKFSIPSADVFSCSTAPQRIPEITNEQTFAC